ncbi:MAG TPA: response regulator [Candidatus Polarisedimenticolia bacterium]|nr:response regulator [Candidatus Polarisedimenticolia bacterium]
MSRRRILVVDDSVLIRQVLADAFTPAGFQVESAGDGLEAIRRIGEARPDVIIADILMPAMDGWALCEALRRDPVTRDIPIVFLTTERDVPKRIKGLGMGADDYVCKPFSKEELMARVEAILRRVAREPEQEAAPADVASPRPSLAGHTDELPMADLLQHLSINNRSGTVHLRGESLARIYLRDGRLLNAETQGVKGEKALFRIMSWPWATFEFEPGEPPRDVEAALEGAASTVLMEGFAHLDELRDLIASLPPRACRLRVTPSRAAETASMELSTTQRMILRTAGGRGATVAEIVDSVPVRDLEAYTVLADLLGRGLLERLSEQAG